MHREGWRKAIPEGRDGVQSSVLVGVVVPLLVFGCWKVSVAGTAASVVYERAIVFPLLFSFGLAALAWKVRSATLLGAGAGFLVSMILTQAPVGWTGFDGSVAARPAFPALIALTVLTFCATRYGRANKEERGVAESRSGRRASQIVANTGVAALCAAMGWYGGCIAALAEAAADTVSSEVGQAIGGPAWLITTFRRVPAGKDGGVSVAGTLAGVAAAGVVVMAGSLHHALWPHKGVVFAAACAGLVFDSVLGATVEEWGWLGNDLVNFSATLFAAALPWVWVFVRGRIVF